MLVTKGVGAVLSQKHDNAQEQVVACASHALTKSERRCYLRGVSNYIFY